MLLYLIRHADPVYNPDTLTPKGRLQAAAVAKRLAEIKFDRIYSSPLGRALETAKPTADLLGLEIGVEEWMSEDKMNENFVITGEDRRRFCTYMIQNTKIKTDEALSLGDRWHEHPCFKGAKPKRGMERIARCSDEFLRRHGYAREGAVYRIENPPYERIAVFGHHGFGTAWLIHLLNIPPHIFWASFDLPHTGVSILEFKNNENGLTAPRCLCLSDLSHIYAEGLPMKYGNFIDI